MIWAGLDRWRRALLVLCAAGVTLFGGLLLASYAAPLTIERLAREAIRLEVERRVGGRIDALSDTRLAGLARKALEKTTADAEAAERALREQVPRRVANAVADMLEADCECRRRLERWAQDAAESRLEFLHDAQARLSDWIEQAYASTQAQLLRELRIFSATNAACLLMLGGLCRWRRLRTPPLMLAAATVFSAAVVVGGFYLFKQDWLHTLVFGRYVGWGFAAYLAGVTGLFADIAFNQARVTSSLLHGIATPSC